MQSDGKPPTLADVARSAGVSTATVSRVLNGTGVVSADVTARVTEAVESLGYMPNFAARVMSARRSFTMGAIIPTMENAIFARGLQAFEEQLHTRGYTLLVASSGYDPNREDTQLRTLISRGVDGLLLIGMARDASVYARLEQYRVPAVAAWTYDPDAPLPTVGFDNAAAMERISAEVFAQGHRNVAMISGNCDGNDRAAQRRAGFVRAAEAAGASYRVTEVDYVVEAAEQVAADLLSAADRPTAFVCGNDVLAVGALKAARLSGLGVPDDLSITGFDDLELTHIVSPPLTTMRVPHRAMGAQAATVLMNLVEGQEATTSVDLGTKLVERGSLAPPR